VSNQTTKPNAFWQRVSNARIAGVVSPSDEPHKQSWGLVLEKEGKSFILWLSGDKALVSPAYARLDEV